MKLLAKLREAFDTKDIPVVLLALGMLLVSYGAYRFNHALGFIVCGLFLILYVRPLSTWVK